MRLSNGERRRRILEQVSRREVSKASLMREFGVSEMTIRRDLAALEKDSKILRVDGGAVSSQRLDFDFSFKEICLLT